MVGLVILFYLEHILILLQVPEKAGMAQCRDRAELKLDCMVEDCMVPMTR